VYGVGGVTNPRRVFLIGSATARRSAICLFQALLTVIVGATPELLRHADWSSDGRSATTVL
jgi:hypothetical protein